MTRHRMYINGQRVESQSGAWFPVYDPSTEEIIAEVPDADAADIDRAVQAAVAAFETGPWPQTTAQDRGRLLFKIAERIRTHAPALAELESRNCGKPIVEAEYDVSDAATCFEYYGGMATKVLGHVNPVPDNALSLSLREPVGVAGQIIPWNYPLLMAAWKLAPALAAGCTCVLKPAEQTPLTALEIADWFADIGFPPGVVNIVTGFGESAGAPLVAHPGVNKIAFTGSAAVGKIIVKSAADTVKRVTLELGGKSPNIFFADADFEAAIDGPLFGVFINQGEVCSAGSRILVEKPIYGKFVEAMVEKSKRIRLGAPLDRETKMGPLVSQEQYDRVRQYQELGKSEARLVAGGGRPTGLPRDYYVEPTIFADVDNSARIAREEIFGPVAASFRSKAKPPPSASPTTRLMAWPPPSGRVISSAHSGL
jgi:betaine-aldehyde dehydrogenase